MLCNLPHIIFWNVKHTYIHVIYVWRYLSNCFSVSLCYLPLKCFPESRWEFVKNLYLLLKIKMLVRTLIFPTPFMFSDDSVSLWYLTSVFPEMFCECVPLRFPPHPLAALSIFSSFIQKNFFLNMSLLLKIFSLHLKLTQLCKVSPIPSSRSSVPFYLPC